MRHLSRRAAGGVRVTARQGIATCRSRPAVEVPLLPRLVEQAPLLRTLVLRRRSSLPLARRLRRARLAVAVPVVARTADHDLDAATYAVEDTSIRDRHRGRRPALLVTRFR